MRVRQKKIILLLAVFIAAITLLRLAFLSFQAPIVLPAAKAGVLDLRGQKLPADRTVTLNGEWAFYPSRFVAGEEIEPANPAASGTVASYIQVPGYWDSSFGGEASGSIRYGTYRLVVLTDSDDTRTYKLRTGDILKAAAVYVNGQYAGGAGEPSDDPRTYRAASRPFTATLSGNGGVFDIRIHVANHIGNGGIAKPIHFGTAEAVDSRVTLSAALQLGLCVVLLLHGLYALILYLLGAEKKGIFFFILIILFAAGSVLTADDKLLFAWLDPPYDVALMLALLSYTGVVAFLPHLFKQLYPAFGSRKLLTVYTYFCLIYFGLVLLVGPVHELYLYVRHLLAAVMLSSVLMSVQILKDALRRDRDAIFLLFSSVSLGVNILWAIAESNTFDPVHYPFDMMIAVMGFSAFWFKRFFRSVNESKRLAERLERINRQKDQFLVNTSHELRNPLHGVMSISQSLLGDADNPLDEEQRKRVEIQLAVARRLAFMLDDLIDASRLKENGVRLQLGSVRLRPVITGTLELIRYMLNGKPIALRIEMEESFPPVRADENRLVQILFNLLHNAIKFTDAGEITIRADIDRGMARIQVEDTGVGIDEQTMWHVFMPYEQGESSYARASGGFGLGLAVCKQLVELHGGRLEAQSVPGEGSVFTFTLPLTERSGDTLPEGTAPLELVGAAKDYGPETIRLPESAHSEARPNLLVVDDESLNLVLFADMIGTGSYNITAVTSGTEALAKLETERYDLIVADVMMPRMSGYELTRIVRQRYSAIQLPILLLTARNRAEDTIAGFEAGANDYVAKPVHAGELRIRVQALTNLKWSIEERLRLEAAWLQAQIRPHFLYNTLNSIAALGAMNVPKMMKLLEVFSGYLRLSFDLRNGDRVVSLRRELELVRAYLFIEKERFGERLKVQWETGEHLECMLPPLSVQTLVENAVNHGILPRQSGGTVRIRSDERDGYIEISVIDNGVGIREDQIRRALDEKVGAGGGIGLRNTNDRLKHLYGEGLRIQSGADGGTTVTFRIPV